MTIDFRTRNDVDVETIDVADFFGTQLPRLAVDGSALAVPGARELGVRPFTIETTAGTWTLSVDDDAVRVRGRVAVSELEVPAPHRVTEIAAPLAVDQPLVALAVAAFTACGTALDQATHGGHGDIGDHDRADSCSRLHVLTHIAAAAGLAGCPVDDHALPVEVHAVDEHRDRFLPSQAREGQDDGHQDRS